MDVYLRGIGKDNKPFYQVYKVLDKAAKDKRLNGLTAVLERKAEVFDKLRSAMRIALPESWNGICDNGDDTDMKSIEEKVVSFRRWLTNGSRKKITYAKMIEQLDKYWVKLFADQLSVVTSEGVLYIQPQRTNNILERFFRGEKRRNRKRSGTASLNKVLKAVLADTPLVQNLQNSEYMDIILNGCSSLAERFSQIDTRLVQKEMEKATKSNERILPGIRTLTRDSDLTTKISLLFSSHAK